MGKGKKKPGGLKRVGEIMDSLDSPHADFDMTEQFQKNGAGAPPGPRPTQALLESFRGTYEPVSSEHIAQELFTMGRLREYFQAWVIPKMPDPLPVYIDELAYMGFPMRTSFDGSPCIMVRYRGAMEVQAEDLEIPEAILMETPEEFPVYTDDWNDDLSDLPPFEE